MTEPSAAPRASIADFMSAAPKSVSGSSPWAQRYAAEIRRCWAEYAAQDPRSLQRHLGPSELGVECDLQVVWKLLGIPTTNHVNDPWPSMRGKALHSHAEGVFTADNLRAGWDRWQVERRVIPHPEHPGSSDLYDEEEQTVVDHKFLGESTMAKIRRGPGRKYRGQLFLYGLGYVLLGFPVRRVAIAAYPATAASLDGLYVWDHTFADLVDDGAGGQTTVIRPDVLEVLAAIFADTDRRKAQAAEVEAGRLDLRQVPIVPDNEECYFCPAFRPQAAADAGPGCPGTSKRAGGAS